MTQQRNQIDHISLGRTDQDVFATAPFERDVSIWSLESQRKLTEVRTILDFGGNRLAIVPPHQCVVTGSWSRGVSAYDYFSGEVLWSHPLKHIQYVTDLSWGNDFLVGVGVEEKNFRAFDHNGKEQWNIPGVEECYPSPFQNLFAIVSANHLSLSSLMGPIWRRRFDGDVLLHAAFSMEQIAVSSAAGPIQCFDFYGNECWRYAHAKGCHALEIAWSKNLASWIAVVKDYERGEQVSVLQIDTNGSGRTVHRLAKHAIAKVFPISGFVVSSEGKVFSSENGQKVWKFL